MANRIEVLVLPTELFKARDLLRFVKSEPQTSSSFVNVEIVYDAEGNPACKYLEEAEALSACTDLKPTIVASKTELSENLLAFISNVEYQKLVLRLFIDDKTRSNYIKRLLKLYAFAEDKATFADLGISEQDVIRALSTRDTHVAEKPLSELVTSLEKAGFTTEIATRVALLSNVDFTFTNTKSMSVRTEVARNYCSFLEKSNHLFDKSELEILYAVGAFVLAKSYTKSASSGVDEELLVKFREYLSILGEMGAAERLEFIQRFFNDPRKKMTPKKQAIVDAVEDAYDEHSLVVNAPVVEIETVVDHPHLKTRVIKHLLQNADLDALAAKAVQSIMKNSHDMQFYVDLLELNSEILDRVYIANVLKKFADLERSTKPTTKKGKDLVQALDIVAGALSRNKDARKDKTAFREFLTSKDFSLGVTARLLSAKKLVESDVKIDVIYSLLPEDHPGGETLALLGELSPYANAQTFATSFAESRGLEPVSAS